MHKPAKRRRLNPEDIAVEIALRKRIVETIQFRLDWALVLQEALDRETPSEVFSNYGIAATDAFLAAGEQIQCLASQPPLPPLPPSIPKPRTTLRNKRKLSHRTPNSKDKKFIFITSKDGSPVLLACSFCGRSNFTTLQGLYNHGKAAHSSPWSSHNECVKSCSTSINGRDVAHGNEIMPSANGFRPDLRGIFEKVVSAPPATKDSEDAVEPSNSLSRNLGIHEESPALAPFLGRQFRRREINVYETHEILDIETLDSTHLQADSACSTSCTRTMWKRSLPHRNRVTDTDLVALRPFTAEEKDKSLILTPYAEGSAQERVKASPADPPDVPESSSRFHISTRIVLTDRSLWRVGGIPNSSHTHKWMITVESPSYSHHITTLLKSISVTPTSNLMTTPTSLTCSTPPYVVVGTADMPFLARVLLTFNGAPDAGIDEQCFTFEHWVDLDPTHSARGVVGDQQTVDVDLDKRTRFRPRQVNYLPVTSKALWDIESSIESKSVLHSERLSSDESDSALSKLVTQFPNTQKEFQRRARYKTPMPNQYQMCRSASQLQNLLTGRRKAIEWGRSRAICEAYNKEVRIESQLSTADVFAWLSEHGHFVRPSPSPVTHIVPTLTSGPSKSQSASACAICGLVLQVHPSANKGPSQQTSACTIISPSSATYDQPIKALRALNQSRLQYAARISQLLNLSYAPRRLITSVDPAILVAVRKSVQELSLPTFTSPGLSTYPIDEFGRNPSEVESHLSPYALLAVTLKPLMKTLVDIGIEVSARDLNEYKRTVSRRKPGNRVMTPSHIYRGLRASPLSNALRAVLFLEEGPPSV